MKNTYRPKTKHDRHQKYVSVFEGFCVEHEYHATITRFMMDSNISSSNPDDIELFKDLLFESKFGKIHIYYFDKLLKSLSDKSQFDWTVRVMAKYIEFTGKISEFYQGDILHTLFTELNRTQTAIELLLKHLSAQDRIYLAQTARQFPAVIAKIPKIRLYSLFS